MSFSLRKIDFFHPYIVAIIILIVLAMGYVGSFNYRFEDPLNTQTILTVLFATFLFVIAVFITSKKFKAQKPNEIDIFSERILIAFIILALILQSLNMVLLGGIPLFNSVLKSNATTNLWRVAYPLFLILINILIAKYYDRKYLILVLLGALVFGLNGYRTSVIGILASVFITMFYIGKISRKMGIAFVILIAIGAIGIGYIASQSIATQKWMLNPIELVFYRLAFTLEVLEKIIPLAGTTHGHILSMIFSSGSPRSFIGNYVLHYDVCLTSTLFGPVMLDFGYVGLTIQMLFMGAFLKIMHTLAKNKIGIGIYSIILTHTLIWIETGPTDIMIWFLYLLGLIVIVLALKK